MSAVVAVPNGTRLRGNEIDFNGVLDRYYKKIFNVLLRMTGDFHEAADLAQDVFVQAYRGLPDFRGDSKVYTWLYRIAINRAKNRAAQLERQARVIGGSLDEPIDDEDGLTKEAADSHWEPGELLERRELQRVVREHINNLPPDFRFVIILRDIEGMSYREMAGVVGISPQAIKTRLFRARQRLRRELDVYIRLGKTPALSLILKGSLREESKEKAPEDAHASITQPAIAERSTDSARQNPGLLPVTNPNGQASLAVQLGPKRFRLAVQVLNQLSSQGPNPHLNRSMLSWESGIAPKDLSSYLGELTRFAVLGRPHRSQVTWGEKTLVYCRNGRGQDNGRLLDLNLHDSNSPQFATEAYYELREVVQALRDKHGTGC